MSERDRGKPIRDAWQRHVGNRVIRQLISEHGMHAGYVRNIQADPRVRLKIGRHWRRGTAHIQQEDEALPRLRQTGRYNARAVRFWGNPDELLTVRIDLDPD
jgi:hypothetical protein